MSPLLGCVADDLTGATDLALILKRAGMRVVQVIGEPSENSPPPEADAIVVALKSRTIAPGDAVRQSLASLNWLRAARCRQFFFKYCSTFDSTDDGNIGPVCDAFLDALNADVTIACPAFPENARSVYQGHLFVGDQLLSESPLKDHPLTPMTDPNLVRVLQRQSKARVGLVPFPTVKAGPDAVRSALDDLASDGPAIAIVDAIDDANLMTIGAALDGLALVTGGSGVAMGLPENFRKAGLLEASGSSDEFAAPDGSTIMIAGSCSAATRKQVEIAKATLPHLQIDPDAVARGEPVAASAIAWAKDNIGGGPALIYSSADPKDVAAVQERLGRTEAGDMIEKVFADIAQALRDAGVTRFIVAGGETSGAVVTALDVSALRIGPEIDPGVPWTTSTGDRPIALALKSGNFGAEDFFLKAEGMLQ